MLDELLLAHLVDPVDHQPLVYLASRGVLYNPRRRRRFEVRDGIAVLLESEAHDVSEEEGRALEQDPEARWSGAATR